MTTYLVKKVATIGILVGADSPGESRRKAEATPIPCWSLLKSGESMTREKKPDDVMPVPIHESSVPGVTTPQKTVDQIMIDDAEKRRHVLGVAVDALWGFIDSAGHEELDGDEITWYVLDDEAWLEVGDDAMLLVDLGLAEIHPNRGHWIRQIAEL